MSDYESRYEEYKQSLLKSHHFMIGFREKYNTTRYYEAQYIDTNGVLLKIGGLSFAFGLCIPICWMQNVWIALRIILAVIGIVCFFTMLRIGSEFKEASGRSNFHSFVYDRHIDDRVSADKDMEASRLIRSFLSREIGREEFQKHYEDLSRYDRFAESLKSDYYFREAVSKIVG